MRESPPQTPAPAKSAVRPLGGRARAAIAASACVVLAATLRPQSPSADIAPAPVLDAMQRAADWQLANPSRHALADWTQGAGDAGFMALAGISANPRYRDAMLAVGEQTHWQLGPRMYHADDHCVGQTFAELFLLYREPRMIAGLKEQFDAILAKPSAMSSLDFTQHEAKAAELWSWCDSLFMAPPAWMRLYAATGDARYMDFAVKNWWVTTDYLFDTGEHLYFRDSTYFKRKEANGRKVFWSRGNGWVMAGLVRMLEYLPMNHPDRPRFERLLQAMAASILACQQPDGLWRASLLDPGSYPMQETSGSGFFTYALAWGVNQGLLDRATFEPAVRSAWGALVRCVDANGMLTHVQPMGADPKRFPENATEVYGVGAFLLAGSEVYRLALTSPSAEGGASPGSRVATVANPAGFFRTEETVEIDMRASGLAAHVAVMDGVSSRILQSQAYASEPGGPIDTLVFQVSLAPGETRRYRILGGGASPASVPPPVVRTYARQVPERYNDMAWESDRIAHRMYSVELIKGEGTVSSGVDVWTKRTRALVIDEWYKRRNYHEDDGDGLDDYQVGRSRGCGGLGIWSGGRLYVSSNFSGARVVTTGPVRSEFELTFDAWDGGGRKVSERRRIAIDAGSNMSRVESVLAADGAAPLDVGVGICRRAGEGNVAAEDRDQGWMTYWQAPDRDRGSIACAVLLAAGAVREFVNEEASVPAVPADKREKPGVEGLPPVGNRLAVTGVRPGAPLVYYLGAGWSRSGDFPDAQAWESYVKRFAQRRDAPLEVSLGP